MPDSGWNPDTLYLHFTALREADLRALSIKEKADEKIEERLGGPRPITFPILASAVFVFAALAGIIFHFIK